MVSPETSFQVLGTRPKNRKYRASYFFGIIFAIISIAILFFKMLHYRNLASHERNKHCISIFSIKLFL